MRYNKKHTRKHGTKRSKDIVLTPFKWWCGENKQAYYINRKNNGNDVDRDTYGMEYIWKYRNVKHDTVIKRAIFEKDPDAQIELALRELNKDPLHAQLGEKKSCANSLIKMAYNQNHALATRMYAHVCYYYLDEDDISRNIYYKLMKLGDNNAKRYIAWDMVTNEKRKDLPKGFKMLKELDKLDSELDPNSIGDLCTRESCIVSLLQCMTSMKESSYKLHYFQRNYIKMVWRWIMIDLEHPNYACDKDIFKGQFKIGHQYRTFFMESTTKYFSAMELIRGFISWGDKDINSYPDNVQNEIITSTLCLKKKRVCNDMIRTILSFVVSPSGRKNYPIIFQTDKIFNRFCFIWNALGARGGPNCKVPSKGQLQNGYHGAWGAWIWWKDAKFMVTKK